MRFFVKFYRIFYSVNRYGRWKKLFWVATIRVLNYSTIQVLHSTLQKSIRLKESRFSPRQFWLFISLIVSCLSVEG